MRVLLQFWRSLAIVVAVAVTSSTLLGQSSAAQDGGDRRSNRESRRNGEAGRPDGGRRRDRDARPPREERPSTPASNSFGTTSEGDRIRKYARDIVTKYDKDDDNILAGDELEGLSSHLRNADSSGDGKITVDEIYEFSSKGSSSAASTSSAKSAAAPAATSSEQIERKITNDKRKSYRFKSTKERTGNWRFSSRDANGDGQVSMSEYSRSWSDRTAAEFMRYDKNNDGMITAAEAK